MRAVGIIAEYNPFHNGHAFQAKEARRLSGADCVIAVMSGHFTQRGEPAFVDKWTRALCAVESGVDLVIELPAVFAVRSAQYFATGGVQLLNRLCFVDAISFGAENPEINQLTKVADALDVPSVMHTRKMLMRTGASYAAALSETLKSYNVVEEEFIRSPNNILGAEYIKAVKSYAPLLRPLPVPRTGSDYHATNILGSIASAGAIRRALTEKEPDIVSISKTIPEKAWIHLTESMKNGWGPPDISRLDALVIYLIRTSSFFTLKMNPEISEGLEHRLIRAASHTSTIHELMDALSCKRYPRSRFRRLLVHLLLGTTREMISEFDKSGPLYARILCSGEKGQKALKFLRKRSQIPLINKLSNHIRSTDLHDACLNPLQKMLSFDIRSTDLFCLMLPASKKRNGGTDFLRSPCFQDINKRLNK